MQSSFARSLACLRSFALALSLVACLTAGAAANPANPAAFDAVSVKSGNWSDGATWNIGKAPLRDSRVLIAPGTQVIYDVDSNRAMREVQVTGRLSFARDRNTKLIVGLLRVTPPRAAGDTGVEDIDKHDHAKADGHGRHGNDHHGGHGDAAADPIDGPALEIGTPDAPIPAPFMARIQLKHFEGMDPEKLPAILCRPGGRLDMHGAPMDRTWVKLGATAKPKDTAIILSQKVTGWRSGDDIVITGSERKPGGKGYRINRTSETRTIVAIAGERIEIDKPLENVHFGEGDFRSEVANLSRTVLIENAPHLGGEKLIAGHTMYHHGSLGSISYARFDGLGKEGVLGRYPIHFHLVGDTMRGSSVIGAAVTNSGNRFITIHGTQYMVIRDCVGHNSVGHGFFLEDGTEVYNTLDRNLAIAATHGKRMKGQALPFDPNDGAGFWWANGRNTFVRNVACENDEYGYRYDSQKTSGFNPNLLIRQPDGSEAKMDIRTIPHYRFQHNESHTEGLYAFVFAGTDGAGPDTSHPHIIRDTTLWETHYSMRTQVPTMLVENLRIHRAAYGIYRPWFENHVYRNVHMSRVSTEPFNRGQDDDSAQAGAITVDGLIFSELTHGGSMPLIQMSDNNLSGKAVSHFRNVKVEGETRENRWPLVNRGGGAVVERKTDKGVPIYIHDYFEPGRHAQVAIQTSPEVTTDKKGNFRKLPPLTGRETVARAVMNVEFPTLLTPVDDQPPATTITYPPRGIPVTIKDGTITIRGTTTDNERTGRVIVNGVPAKDVDYNFHQWEVTLRNVKPGVITIKAHAEDVNGNTEKTPHEMTVVAK